MILRLPFPNSALLPNRRNGKHWGNTATAKAAARDGAYYITKQQMGDYKPPEGSIALSLLFLTPDKRKRDLDGMLSSAKHALDGIAQALGVDDSRFRPILVDSALGPKGGALIAAVGVEIRSGYSLQEVSGG